MKHERLKDEVLTRFDTLKEQGATLLLDAHKTEIDSVYEGIRTIEDGSLVWDQMVEAWYGLKKCANAIRKEEWAVADYLSDITQKEFDNIKSIINDFNASLPDYFK